MERLLFFVLIMLASIPTQAQTAKLGDLNHDNDVTITDVMMLVDIVINGYAPFSVSPTETTMLVDGSATININGGYDSYEVTSANPDIVGASLNGTVITLTAVSAGETTVTVKDVQTFRTIEIPVKVNYKSLIITSSNITLVEGRQTIITIVSGNGSYSVKSSNTNVATANLVGTSITVTAVGAGTATITVTDMKSGQAATIEVTVNYPHNCPDNNHPHMVDLGLPSGTKWACCNVDTDNPKNQSPYNTGGYYAWGETKTKATYEWSTYIYCDGTQATCHNLGSCISGTQYDVAHMKWGGSWQMPTIEQRNELYDNCTCSRASMNNVDGCMFTGSNGASIFLPAAGNQFGSGFHDVGTYGYYWTGTQVSDRDYYAVGVYFRRGEPGSYGFLRYYGCPIRPVTK